MKWLLSVILSVATVHCALYASEDLTHSSPLEQEALLRLELVQKYSDPKSSIPEKLRTIFDPTAERIEEEASLGAGIVRAFQADGKIYVIYGMRFGKSAKLSIGGSVEAADKTIQDAICRELKEEFFGQLPLSNICYADEKLIAGGFQLLEDEKIISEGWGPYITFFAIETGYNFVEIQAAVDIMNANARLHFPVATFFSKVRDLEARNIYSNAQTLLQAFESATKEEGIMPLKPEVTEMLLNLVENPAVLPIEGGFGDFAKKYVHDYTEYSEFNLISLDEFMGLAVKKFSEAESSRAFELLRNSVITKL